MRKKLFLLLAVALLCGGADSFVAGPVPIYAAERVPARIDMDDFHHRGVFRLREDGTYAPHREVRADGHAYKVPGTLVIDTDTAIPEGVLLKVAGDLVVKSGAVLSLDGDAYVGGSLIMEAKPKGKPSRFGKGWIHVGGDLDIGAGALRCEKNQFIEVQKTGKRHCLRIGPGNRLSNLDLKENYENIFFGNMTRENKQSVDLGTVKEFVSIHFEAAADEFDARDGGVLPMFQRMHIRTIHCGGASDGAAEWTEAALRRIAQRKVLQKCAGYLLGARQELLPRVRQRSESLMWSKLFPMMKSSAKRRLPKNKGESIEGRITLQGKQEAYHGTIAVSDADPSGETAGIAYRGSIIFRPPKWRAMGDPSYSFEGSFSGKELRESRQLILEPASRGEELLVDDDLQDVMRNALERELREAALQEQKLIFEQCKWMPVSGEKIDRLADAYLDAEERRKEIFPLIEEIMEYREGEKEEARS